ncbi:MAG: hypothetical protein WCR51_06640 [Planctomycetia bacterium]
MTLDFIDRAFLQRMAEPTPSREGAEAVALVDTARIVAATVPQPPEDPVVRRLLASSPEQWERLAERVEAAWAAGDRVIAVAGRARGEGCSTIVHGLVHVLCARGGIATCRVGDRSPASGVIHADESGGPVLVDAGVWFPPGPLHRGRLARAAIGCHAAVLVRRAERQPCPAHERALTALGIHVLGEVVTFGDPHDSEAASA